MAESVNVLVLERFCGEHMERIREAAGPGATVRQVVDVRDADTQMQLLEGVDVVIGAPRPEALRQADSVRWVQMCWAGTDLYTRQAGRFPQGVRLTNVAGTAYGHIISQFVVGQILALAQNLPTYVRQEATETWLWGGPVMSLDGRQALIFGAGDLGACTAQRLAAFDMTCVGVCRDTSRPRDGFARLVTLGDSEAELGAADVVVCCLPSSEETDGYLDERRLQMLKEGSVLVNVGRGRFIDCEALARVLAEGRLRGAALDVTDPEPLPTGHPLWAEPRCVITPHVAGRGFGSCPETEELICQVVCDNLRRWRTGEPLTHVVL